MRFTKAVAHHKTLEELEISSAPFQDAAALNAFVNAAVARQLTSLKLAYCNLSPDGAPELARLVSGGGMRVLHITNAVGMQATECLDAEGAREFGAALQRSGILELKLCAIDLWRNADAAAELLRALTGHPTLHTLNLEENSLSAFELGDQQRITARDALVAIVAANAPALRELDLTCCKLHDVELRPILAALETNTHLKILRLYASDTSRAFEDNELARAASRGVVRLY